MESFTFIYEDKDGNELCSVAIAAKDMKDAERQRDIAFANSKVNDLHKIVIRP